MRERRKGTKKERGGKKKHSALHVWGKKEPSQKKKNMDLNPGQTRGP